jgi:hypothetical protein
MKIMGIQGIIRGKPHKTTIPDKNLPCPLERLCRILCPGAFCYAIGKRSSNMMANWLLMACHSRTERFHS